MPQSPAQQPDLPARVDVLVAGSAAAGLTAALTCAVHGLRVLVCERAPVLGGTSALSGGRVWIPGNGFLADPEGDRRAARRYLARVFDERHPEMADAFLEAGPAMLRAVRAHTPRRFVPCPSYPEYHPELDGATLGGRCLDATPLELASLDPLVEHLRHPGGYLPITHAEWERWRLPHRYDWALLDRRRRERIATGGVALVAALLDGVVRAGGDIRVGHRLMDVQPGAGNGVVVRLERPDRTDATLVVLYVILATGGYDQDARLRREYLPRALAASASSPTNTGDALLICQRLGAPVDNLGQGWWMPMLAVPGECVDGAAAYRSLIRERGSPRLILVDRSGRRFTDEAAPYNELGKALHRHDEAGRCPHAEAFLIFDAGFRRRYPLPGLSPGAPDPDWVIRAPTLAELAQRLGIDPAGLADEVDRWNSACQRGIDAAFGRGANPYDRYYGDPDQPGNPNLGAIDEPPYYGRGRVRLVVASGHLPGVHPQSRVTGLGHVPGGDGGGALGITSPDRVDERLVLDERGLPPPGERQRRLRVAAQSRTARCGNPRSPGRCTSAAPTSSSSAAARHC